MKVSIMDKGCVYNYDKMFRMSLMNDSNQMVINYIDENGEKHQEVGDLPEYIAISDEILISTRRCFDA